NAKVPFALAWRLGCRVDLATLPPTFETSKERLNAGIRGMRMELVAREQAHQVFGLEPDILMPNSTPEEDERFAVEQATFMSQFIELGGLAQVHASYLIHGACPP